MDSGAMLSFGGVIIATFLASVGLFWRIFARTEDKLDCLDRRLSRLEGKKESEATVTEFIVKNTWSSNYGHCDEKFRLYVTRYG